MTSALYIVARTVLLDALEALIAQHDAIVLVGAQAIYLHTGDADIAVPAFTADGDVTEYAATIRYFAGADRGLPLSTTYVPINVVLTDPVLRPLCTTPAGTKNTSPVFRICSARPSISSWSTPSST
jgi:hypothetical protein